MNNIYSNYHYSFVDKIIKNKRQEMCDIINKNINNHIIFDALDVGTTNDEDSECSNYVCKNLEKITEFKSISDQLIQDTFFQKILKKSVTEDFTSEEINSLKSDLVISNATIEHVGNFYNQTKMIKNIKNLSKKFFFITTPNKYHPIEFHTKLPFIHWLPKKVYRKILNFLKLDFFSKEENLNLLSEEDLKIALKNASVEEYKIFYIYLMGFKSNFLVFGKIT